MYTLEIDRKNLVQLHLCYVSSFMYVYFQFSCVANSGNAKRTRVSRVTREVGIGGQCHLVTIGEIGIFFFSFSTQITNMSKYVQICMGNRASNEEENTEGV